LTDLSEMVISVSPMSKRRYTSLADYFARGPETQEQLAKRIGYSQPSISEALRGRGSYRLLKKISDATGVPLESFGRTEAA
jgi:transcriptional regulator with XRE-family HTH domain